MAPILLTCPPCAKPCSGLFGDPADEQGRCQLLDRVLGADGYWGASEVGARIRTPPPAPCLSPCRLRGSL